MSSRSRRAVVKGVGSLADIGGTSFKRAAARSQRGSFETDKRAMSKDFQRAVAKLSASAAYKSK